jgi:hypothetical protein
MSARRLCLVLSSGIPNTLFSGIGFDYAKTVGVDVLTTTYETAAVALEDAAGWLFGVQPSGQCARRMG